MNETCILALSETESVKLPSMSETVPFVVPTSTILAPITASPAASVIMPVIFFFCATAVIEHKRKTNKIKFFLMFFIVKTIHNY